MNYRKKDNFYEYNNFNNLKLVIYFSTILIIILNEMQNIHLNSLKSNLIDFNDSFIKYRKFSKYYFQLFPITLSLTCIQLDTFTCENIIFSCFNKLYYQNPDLDCDLIIL